METAEIDLDAIEHGYRLPMYRDNEAARTALALAAEVRKGREAADILGRALSGLNRALAEQEVENGRLEALVEMYQREFPVTDQRRKNAVAALDPIVKAWADAGPQPHAHRQAQRRLLRDWPTLANALTRAVPPIVGG